MSDGNAALPEADFIVIGGGTAGAVVAARLSENPRMQVLLIEAGGADRSPWIHMPIGFGKTFGDPVLNWRFESAPEPALDGRRIYLPAGRVLGGTSSINGMIYIRGTAADYDHWRDMGNPGWGHSDVLPWFLKSEDQVRGADAHHGTGGPMHISDSPGPSPTSDAFIDAALALGHAPNPDFNGTAQLGVGLQQRYARRGCRVSTATAYLRPNRSRPNLRILTRAEVQRIRFEGRRATAVEIRHSGRLVTARARREIVLSAGSFQSPKLLMLSGIGPASHLSECGLAVVHDNPAVGANLQDHFGASVKIRCRLPITTNDALRGNWGKFRAGLRYLLRRNGPLAIGSSEAALFARSSQAEGAEADLKVSIAAFSADSPQQGLHPWPGITLVAAHLKPASRGRLRLAGPDPMARPVIEPNFLSSPADCIAIVEALSLCRAIAGVGAMQALCEAELLPGSNCRTDEDLLTHARATGGSLFHPTSTCAMGPRGVVDAKLRVRGVDGLRVADASVMPQIIGGNTAAATIMIAERAAGFILDG